VIEGPPRDLGRLARTGEVAAACWAVADHFELGDTVAPLGSLGIACDGPVLSVLLFSRRPAWELTGARVAVTLDTSTSVRLLEQVLAGKYGLEGVEYERREMPGTGDGPAPDAFLVIGDRALDLYRRGADGYPHCHDLAEEWRDWTGLPFVFARWGARRDLPEESTRAIRSVLERSLDEALAGLPALAAREAERLGLDTAYVRRYLEGFSYRLGPREEAGLRRFREMVTVGAHP
jgi:chorismate dehydratase